MINVMLLSAGDYGLIRVEYHKVGNPAAKRKNPFVVDDDDEDEELARLISPIDLLPSLPSSPLPSSPLKKPGTSINILLEKKRQFREDSPEIAFVPSLHVRAASHSSNRSSPSIYVDYDPAAHLIASPLDGRPPSGRQSNLSAAGTISSY